MGFGQTGIIGGPTDEIGASQNYEKRLKRRYRCASQFGRSDENPKMRGEVAEGLRRSFADDAKRSNFVGNVEDFFDRVFG